MVTTILTSCRIVLTCPTDDQPHFLRYATELAGCLRGTIFADQVVYPHVKQNDVLQLLEEHITENIVKVSTSHYDVLTVINLPCRNVDREPLLSTNCWDTPRLDSVHSPLLLLLRRYGETVSCCCWRRWRQCTSPNGSRSIIDLTLSIIRLC